MSTGSHRSICVWRNSADLCGGDCQRSLPLKDSSVFSQLWMSTRRPHIRSLVSMQKVRAVRSVSRLGRRDLRSRGILSARRSNRDEYRRRRSRRGYYVLSLLLCASFPQRSSVLHSALYILAERPRRLPAHDFEIPRMHTYAPRGRQEKRKKKKVSGASLQSNRLLHSFLSLLLL